MREEHATASFASGNPRRKAGDVVGRWGDPHAVTPGQPLSANPPSEGSTAPGDAGQGGALAV